MKDREEIEHPAFGMIHASRISGQRNLFMVDYPQGHFVRLTIAPATLIRDLSNDWVHSRAYPLIEVDLSEVQWARMISSMNTTGVPCTLNQYADPKHPGNVEERPKMPENHVGKAPTFKREVEDTKPHSSKGGG